MTCRIRAGGGKIELVRPLTIMLKLLLYTHCATAPLSLACIYYIHANERGAVAQCALLRSAKHEHSRGSGDISLHS